MMNVEAKAFRSWLEGEYLHSKAYADELGRTLKHLDHQIKMNFQPDHHVDGMANRIFSLRDDNKAGLDDLEVREAQRESRKEEETHP